MSFRDRINTFVARHEIAWELVFAALAILFVAVSFIPVEPGSDLERGVLAFEWLLTGIFAAEFFGRLWASHDRRAYVRGHWIDLLALIPPIRPFRLLRLLRIIRLVRAFAGIGRAMAGVERLAGHKGLIWLLAAWSGVMVLTALGLYLAEVGPNPSVTSPWDAVWWGISTMTTVGYGDVYPITAEGRLAAAVLMLLGILLFSGVTATLTSFLVGNPSGEATDVVDRLERLSALRAQGSLSDEEFVAAKALLLATQRT